MTTKKISLTPSQTSFLELTEAYTLFCAGYGSGKSYLMGLSVVLDAMHGDDATIGVYEPEKKHIRTVAVPAVEHWLNEFNIKYTYNKNENTIYVESPGIGDILFFPMDNPATLVGYETYRSHIDEFDTLPEERASEIWARIMGRNRRNPDNIPENEKIFSEEKGIWEANNKIRAYSTPEGFKFCYKKWGTGEKENHAIVHGKSRENPTLPTSFFTELESQYTKPQLEAYLNGQFVNLTSGSVYYAYDREGCKSAETIQPSETLYIGCDFNVNNMSAAVYVKRRGGSEWHIVDELHGLRDTPDMIDEIKDRWHSLGHRIIMYPDATGVKTQSTNASVSDINLLRQAGFSVRAKSINPRVKDRVSATNKALEANKVFINYIKCPQAAACFEQHAYDKAGKPCKKSGHDHMTDAATYLLAYELPIRKKAFKLDISFML